MLAALLLAAAALPPVTQAEAVDFHRRGLCQMADPGEGITRADGRGWIASSLPGLHEVTIGDDRVLRLDLTPGQPVPIVVPPGASVVWCPRDARPAGRAACGPVPRAFLYDAKLATDPPPR